MIEVAMTEKEREEVKAFQKIVGYRENPFPARGYTNGFKEWCEKHNIDIAALTPEKVAKDILSVQPMGGCLAL